MSHDDSGRLKPNLGKIDAESDDTKTNEQFQECLRIISEEGNRQKLIKELEKEKTVLLHTEPYAVPRVEQHIIEYISEVLTYIDFRKIVTSPNQLLDFFSGSDFQATFKQTMTNCLQFVADRMNEPDQKLDCQALDDWANRLSEFVKSREFASRVFQAWTSKKKSEKLFENISELCDGKYTTSWKKLQKAVSKEIKDFDQPYTIAVFAKCTMSLTEEDMGKIMPDAIEKLKQQKFVSYSKNSMSEFFKAIRNELETLRQDKLKKPVIFPSDIDKNTEISAGSNTSVLMRIVNDIRSAFVTQSDTLTRTSMENARQIQLLSENKTIWHAVSAFSKEDGRTSWNLAKIVKSMTENMELEPPDWVTGKDRGVFGETPLHIALLWNKPETPGLTEIFNELWDMCPRLRTKKYKHPLYRGENVLHIAIVKKVDPTIIHRIIESAEWEKLREQRAVGSFFKPKQKSDGACNILGEHVLSFAACTNQRMLFRYMVSKGACLRITTSEGNGLLHLMVLNAFDRKDREGAGGAGQDSAAAGSSSGEGRSAQPNIVDMYKGMYDEIEGCMGEQGILEAMRREENHEGYTPLKLAAAVGSLDMFNHLFEKEVEVAWIFGPVVCRKVYLKGIDVPLRPTRKSARTAGPPPAGNGKPGGKGKLNVCAPPILGPRKIELWGPARFFVPWVRQLLCALSNFLAPFVPGPKEFGSTSGGGGVAENPSPWPKDFGVEDEGEGRSVLEILVDNKRKDIIAHSLIDKIVEAKWSRYGRGIFHARLACAIVFTGLVYIAPMANPDHLTAGCRTAHAAVYVALCCWLAPDFLGEADFLFRLASDALLSAAQLPDAARDEGMPEDVAETWKLRARRAELYFQVRSKFYRVDIESLFSLFATPILVALTVINLSKAGIPATPASSQCWCWCTPTAGNTTQSAAAEDALALAAGAPEAVAEASLLTVAAKSLHASLSVLSFLMLLYLGMGFEHYGAFILMIVRITRKDLPVFMVVYTVFLLGVGHLHYFASNELHAGVFQGMDSVWRIFSAVTGDIHPEDKHLLKGPLAHPLTMAVCVANFFFVTTVLMNLLIAMLSQTYDEISRDARESWKLHRAAILIKIDRAVSPARRASDVFWQTTPSDNGARRFITFNCFHGRADFLRKDTFLLPTLSASESEAVADTLEKADKVATQLTLEVVKAQMDAMKAQIDGLEGKLDRLLDHTLRTNTTPPTPTPTLPAAPQAAGTPP